MTPKLKEIILDDALAVFAKTGLIPHELSEDREKLLSALKGMLEWASRVMVANRGMEVATATIAVSHAEDR